MIIRLNIVLLWVVFKNIYEYIVKGWGFLLELNIDI